MSHQPPRVFLSGIHLWKDFESERLTTDHPETEPITIKPETVSHVAEHPPGFPRPLLSTGRPFPAKAFALSVHVSPPYNSLLRPWKESPFLQ